MPCGRKHLFVEALRVGNFITINAAHVVAAEFESGIPCPQPQARIDKGATFLSGKRY